MNELYHVYLHYRLSDGLIFYVGKGNDKRVKCRWSRSDWWHNVSRKHGWRHEIVQSFEVEDDAFLLEMWLIAKLKIEGYPLVNMTEGGEGASGNISPLRRKIYCSNGMDFSHGYEAAQWCREEGGYPNARQGHIASVCRGDRARAYGLAWSYDETPIDDAPSWKAAIGMALSKPVNCSNGLRFSSCVKAKDWIATQGWDYAVSTRISSCASGATNSAYGYAWWYDGDEPKEYVPATVSIECIGHGVFENLKIAADWVSSHTKYKAQGRPIRQCAEGKYKTAYGYTWRFPD